MNAGLVRGFANQIVANPADASLVRQPPAEALLAGVEVVAEVARGPRTDQLVLSDDADLRPLTVFRSQLIDAIGGERGVFRSGQTPVAGLLHAVSVNG